MGKKGKHSVLAIVLLVFLLTPLSQGACNPACGAGKICCGSICKTGNCCSSNDCGSCQYCSSNSCRSYECCSNNHCGGNEYCSGHTCRPVSCSTCYTPNGNHGCRKYTGCSGSNYCANGVKKTDGDYSSAACGCKGKSWVGSLCCGDDGSESWCSGGGYCNSGSPTTDGDVSSAACTCFGDEWITSKCCGDDGSSDTWCLSGNYCNSGSSTTDGDISSAACGCFGEEWIGGKCCGDDGTETWCSSGEYCHNGASTTDGDASSGSCSCLSTGDWDGSACCGDDGGETWCASGGAWYCDAASKITDADDSNPACDCMSTGDWDGSKCCGDDGGESWCASGKAWYCNSASREDDADDSDPACTCMSTGDWDGSQCCGDDGGETWCASGGAWYCDASTRVDEPDDSSESCACMSTGDWDNGGKCCGDDGGENWCAGAIGSGAWYCNSAVRQDDADDSDPACGCMSTGDWDGSKCCGDDGGADTWCAAASAFYCDAATRIEEADDSEPACGCLSTGDWGGSQACCGDDSGESWCADGGMFYCDSSYRIDDADNSQQACECMSTGDWDGSKCCGDDGAADTWCSADGSWYCDAGVKVIEPDHSEPACACMSTGDWDGTQCCGDDAGADTWCAQGGIWYCDAAIRQNDADYNEPACQCMSTGDWDGVKCCGDDGAADTWCSAERSWYCDAAVRQNDADYNDPACACISTGDWYTNKCCGDDGAKDSWCASMSEGYCDNAVWTPVGSEGWDYSQVACEMCVGGDWNELGPGPHDMGPCCGDDTSLDTWCGLESVGYCYEGNWRSFDDYDQDEFFCTTCSKSIWNEDTDAFSQCCGDDGSTEKWCGHSGYCLEGDWTEAFDYSVFAREYEIVPNPFCSVGPLKYFNYADCGDTKKYKTNRAMRVYLLVKTADLTNLKCTHPNFYLFDRLNDESEYLAQIYDFPDQTNVIQHIEYETTGSLIKIKSFSENDCFYLTVTGYNNETLCELCLSHENCPDHFEECQGREDECRFCTTNPELCADENIGGIEGCLGKLSSKHLWRCQNCEKNKTVCESCINDEVKGCNTEENFDNCLRHPKECNLVLSSDEYTFDQCFSSLDFLMNCEEAALTLEQLQGNLTDPGYFNEFFSTNTDLDDDGVLNNLEEWECAGNNDCDGDGLVDSLDPNDHNIDIDGDNVVDGCDEMPENPNAFKYYPPDSDLYGLPQSPPPDSDNDKVPDSCEESGCLHKKDCDNDGLLDGADPDDKNNDSDGDSVLDGEEEFGCVLIDDCDGDNLLDAADTEDHFIDYLHINGDERRLNTSAMVLRLSKINSTIPNNDPKNHELLYFTPLEVKYKIMSTASSVISSLVEAKENTDEEEKITRVSEKYLELKELIDETHLFVKVINKIAPDLHKKIPENLNELFSEALIPSSISTYRLMKNNIDYDLVLEGLKYSKEAVRETAAKLHTYENLEFLYEEKLVYRLLDYGLTLNDPLELYDLLMAYKLLLRQYSRVFGHENLNKQINIVGSTINTLKEEINLAYLESRPVNQNIISKIHSNLITLKSQAIIISLKNLGHMNIEPISITDYDLISSKLGISQNKLRTPFYGTNPDVTYTFNVSELNITFPVKNQEYFWSLFTVRVVNNGDRNYENFILPFKISENIVNDLRSAYFDSSYHVITFSTGLIAWESYDLLPKHTVEYKFIVKQVICESKKDCLEPGTLCDNMKPVGLCNSHCTGCGTICDTGIEEIEFCNGNRECVTRDNLLGYQSPCKCSGACASSFCLLGMCCNKGEYANPITMKCIDEPAILILPEEKVHLSLSDMVTVPLVVVNPTNQKQVFSIEIQGGLREHVKLPFREIVLQPGTYKSVNVWIVASKLGNHDVIFQITNALSTMKETKVLTVTVQSNAKFGGISVNSAPDLGDFEFFLMLVLSILFLTYFEKKQ